MNVEPPYAKHLSRLTRPFSNFDFFFIKGLRKEAVKALQLACGDHVLDLGCGSGASFPYLVEAVGDDGIVVGVDIGHQSCINARRRVAANHWQHVVVIEASAKHAKFTRAFDGALMFAAPDVFACESVLANVVPQLKARARIAIFGAKLSTGRLSNVLNPFFLFMCRKLSPTTPVPDHAPWAMLATLLDNLDVREFFFGSMFLACGTLKEPRPTEITLAPFGSTG